MKKSAVLIVCLSFILIFASFASAATINTASCSRSDVQSALNSASDGDIVIIPSGTCQWTSLVDVNNEVTITGSGDAITETGATTIERYGFKVSSYVNNVRITNIIFDGDYAYAGEYDASIHAIQMGQYYLGIGADGVANFRIDHNKFKRYGALGTYCGRGTSDTCRTRLITVTGHAYGVVDHNLFMNNYGFDVIVAGDQTPGWTRDGIGGFEEATFIEDNTYTVDGTMSFNPDRIADVGNGASVVVRFNTFTGTGTYGGMETIIDTHGLCTSGQTGNPDRGAYNSEVYGNNLTYSMSVWHRYLRSRGGGGFWFNNEITDPNYGAVYMYLDVERAHNTCAGIEGWPTTCTEGYPCQDQIGFPISGDKPDVDLYMWNNILNGAQVTVSLQASSTYLQNGRDYYIGSTPTNTYAGWGTRANRPACARVGQSYWSTDYGEWNSKHTGNDGTLDRCNSNLVWENAWYTPYTYPHPLVTGGAVSDTTPPAFESATNPSYNCSANPKTVRFQGYTNEQDAACKFSEDGDGGDNENTAYDDLNHVFDQVSDYWYAQSQEFACGTTHTFWVRCMDSKGNKAKVSTEITFTIAAPASQPGMVLHLPFDEGQGTTAADSSGNDNTGTLTNGPTWTTGKTGSYALIFDGMNDYANVGDSPTMYFSKSEGTIGMWIKPVNPASGSKQVLVLARDGEGSYEMELALQEDGDLFFYPYYDPNQWHTYNLVKNPLTEGQWQFVAVTWDYSTKEAKIFVDGVEQALAEDNVPSYWSIIASTADWDIGGSPVKDQYFNGTIDDVRIYNYALSASEIQDLYNQGSSSGSVCNSDSDANIDGVVSISELINYISRWKAGSVTIGNLIDAIGKWKSGC